MLRGNIVKDDSASYAAFTEQGSSASQMTGAKVMDVTARLPDCQGQAADAVSAYTQVKMNDAPKLLKGPKSECPDLWIRVPLHEWPKSWSNIEGLVVRNLYGGNWKGTWLGETSHENSRLILWYGNAHEEMRRTMFWSGKSKGRATEEVLYTMSWWPSLQKGRTGNGWRIVKRLLSNCPEMSLFGPNW